ncbi:DUF3304 domain-containing protein [Pseudoduganella buxea]|uniref:DUF3304 domain-containing protein n=1 Tax=Pseudoduganella buxea TaxID=1949069 RepID=A0A6I3T4X5_9BURK|nr:DUF3304 domain-containing protein [Pseudoduganella buxea]MTV55985.1 DUF3304 domain-containing protein [Pseudoduganella buxea]GGC07534.1 hypothetical protein GCM10011572_31510 [Pseudoduganella buxea]
MQIQHTTLNDMGQNMLFHFTSKHIPITIAVFFLSMISGCFERNINLEVCGLNYTSLHIDEFTVNGYSGANISANGGGGGFTCCIALPRKWHEGMSVKIRWTNDGTKFQNYKERTVAVPKYSDKDLGFLAVHFYPDDSVKVLVTNHTDSFPGYPYPRPANKSP